MNRLWQFFKNHFLFFHGESCFVHFRNGKPFYIYFASHGFSPISEEEFIKAISEGRYVQFVLRDDDSGGVSKMKGNGECALMGLNKFKQW